MADILLIECFDFNIDPFQQALSDKGKYNLVPCPSGYTALESIALKRFDLIIIDQDLPYLSGLKTARSLRKRLGYEISPFIIISSDMRESTLEDFFGTGVYDFLEIPLNVTKIKKSVDYALLNWKAPNDNLKNYIDYTKALVMRK